MKEPYLEVTYRKGQVVAAYYYLPRARRAKVASTRQADPGLVIDFDAAGRPLGIELTAPAKVTATSLNRVLRELGCAPLRRGELKPLHAA